MSNGKKINTNDTLGATRKSIADTAVEALKEGRLGRMSYLHVKSGFKLSTLALSIGLSLVSPQLFALEALDDASLANSTGEGIAVLPQDFSVRMNGADNNNSGQGTFDTGYIRLIPVGPLTTEATANGAGKADIFLYGLAISQSNKNYGNSPTNTDLENRFGRNITSWGSAVNPWLLKVATEQDVPNFSALTPTDQGKGDVSYLTMEAPLYHADTDNDFNNAINAGITGLSTADKSAYNLKLGLWTDIFVRDPKVMESMTATGTQFDLGGANRANRLRLQAVWDGFSLNGTNVKIFQTLGGATNKGGMSKFYNNTLGIAGVVRLNSGDSSGLKATTTYQAGTRTVDPYTTTWDGSKYGTTANYTDTSGTINGAASPNCAAGTTAHRSGSCMIQYQTRAITDTASSATWTMPNVGGVLRFSSREAANPAAQGNLSTPAINGGTAPTFDANEGLYLYNPNINIVLGSLYQPLTVGVAPDGKNITLELASLPNKESIYKKVYINYDNPMDPTTNGGYTGSTCNVHYCGKEITLNGVKYQGSNATHSSISIGSTEYDASKNALTAYKGIESFGVSFGALIDGSKTTAAQAYRDVQQRTRTATNFFGWSYNGWGNWSNLAVGNSALYNLKANSPNTWTQQTSLQQPDFATPQSAIPSNNLGSVAIDGLMIQHMKITTKGL